MTKDVAKAKLAQARHNEMTKARIKIRRSGSLSEAVNVAAEAVIRSLIFKFFEEKIIPNIVEGEGWVALRPIDSSYL